MYFYDREGRARFDTQDGDAPYDWGGGGGGGGMIRTGLSNASEGR